MIESHKKKKSRNNVYQFKITLLDIDPPIWRRIQVPEAYSFWDLHVAIQNAMGWLDCHLHTFKFIDVKSGQHTEIGIPDDLGEFGEVESHSGLEVEIVQYFQTVGGICFYEYDFGDGWAHEILLEEILPIDNKQKYPACLAGERTCPPENCGGVPGYYNLLEIMSDPGCDQYQEKLEWMGDVFHPENFSPETIRFENPQQHWALSR